MIRRKGEEMSRHDPDPPDPAEPAEARKPDPEKDSMDDYGSRSGSGSDSGTEDDGGSTVDDE